jgi:hypothetical protein
MVQQLSWLFAPNCAPENWLLFWLEGSVEKHSGEIILWDRTTTYFSWGGLHMRIRRSFSEKTKTQEMVFPSDAQRQTMPMQRTTGQCAIFITRAPRITHNTYVSLSRLSV